MSVATLLAESTHENGIPIRRPALAGHDPGTPPGSVLALDLGQKTGWAVCNTDGAITSGAAEFKPGRFEGGGMIYLRFRAWLQEADKTTGGVGVAYFEEVRFHRGVTAAQVRGVPVATIKRHVTGRGKADKDAVIAAVRALGSDPADHNETDALALLHWALAQGGGR